MAKAALKYVCQDCGSWHGKWVGKCEGCGAWNRLVEEVTTIKQKTSKGSPQLNFVTVNSNDAVVSRFQTGMVEFDRVCGGGLVPGAVLLVGGDPGIGKSTLLLQVTALLSQYQQCVYVSGEEAIDQIRLRAQRLNITQVNNLHLASSTNIQEIVNGMASLPDQPGLLVIDSIQTMASDDIDSSPGTVSQVRACTHDLIQLAKKRGIVVILVGHVTKEGVIAGPRVLEHMVDTVLYFEGERNYQYRVLRAVKNRFGATDEIGVFEMCDTGLSEVSNPSALFLNQHDHAVSGAAIFAGIEGTRPILMEIQALVAPSHLATPRRTSVGWDNNRLAMILAVLEARCGLSFANRDVYLNIAGGLKITEPAADLAVAAALISALRNTPLPSQSIFFGEIGLAGDVRAVSHADLRKKEAAKLGFTQAFCATPKGRKTLQIPEISENHLSYLIEILDFVKTRTQDRYAQA